MDYEYEYESEPGRIDGRYNRGIKIECPEVYLNFAYDYSEDDLLYEFEDRFNIPGRADISILDEL